MALVSCFYFTFPRRHLYVGKYTYIISKVFRTKFFKVSAIWYLPLYFLKDFFDIFKENCDYVNHFAHVGGFLWGALF